MRLAEFAENHPAVGQAWTEGRLDEDRVRVLCDGVAALSSAHAEGVLVTVLPEAPGLTLKALEDRVAEVAVGLDPDWAEKVYRRRVAQRRVRARRTEGGTLNMSGLDLPLDTGTGSVAYLTLLAARAQALGHPGLVDTVRADVMLVLISPRSAGLDDDALAAATADLGRARAAAQRAAGHTERDGADLPADPGPTDPAPRPGPGSSGGQGRALPRQGRIELRVGLGTLLGRNEHPGRLPGYGVVHAGLARDMARRFGRVQWRVAVSDERGHVTAALLPVRRPLGYATAPVPGIARPVVEIHVRADELARLRPSEHPGWSALLRELQDAHRVWVADPPDDCFGADPGRRFANAALARWIQVRDGACVFPPCGATALGSELDHTVPDAADGQTRSAKVPDPQTFVPRSRTEPDERADDGSIWVNDPYPEDPADRPSATRARTPPEDVPPF